MGRARKAVVTIKIPPLARANLDKFLERLNSVLYGDTVIGEIEGDTIKLQIYGSKVSISLTLRKIRELLREYSTPETPRGGRRVSLRLLARTAGTALPPDVLVEVLKLQGYRARVTEDGYLETDAEWEDLTAVASLLGEAIRRLSHYPASRTAKKLLFAALTLDPSLGPERVVDEGLALGVLWEDDEGKIHVRGDWREALKKLLDTRL